MKLSGKSLDASSHLSLISQDEEEVKMLTWNGQGS